VTDITVEFGSSQSTGALREAAYRLIGEASCLIDQVDGRHVCRLIPKAALAGEADEEAIRTRFIDLVTDENLREKVAAETAGVRDVILALAFGALAREREDSRSS
jgi:His-Xaa-Ser system protein HxsD